MDELELYSLLSDAGSTKGDCDAHDADDALMHDSDDGFDASDHGVLNVDFHNNGAEPTTNSSNDAAITAIEDLALDLLEQLAAVSTQSATDTHVSIQLADRKRGGDAKRGVRFPLNRKRGNARGLASLLRVMDLSHESLVSGRTITKRDIFYQDVKLFQTQTTVNNLVDDLAATCGVRRRDLNIAAASKGLFCGDGLTIFTKSGAAIIGHDEEHALIPAMDDIESISIAEDVSWVLVIEKDAVFQTLCRARLTRHSALHGPGILVTGKGYPDIATRQLLAWLSMHTEIPLLALVDSDSHGIDIFSCYKYGSQSLRHEKESLRALRLEWIGLFMSDLQRFGVDNETLLPLNAQDHRKALSLLCSPFCELEPDWRRELTQMMHLRRKAELEVLSSAVPEDRWADSELVEYVTWKIGPRFHDEMLALD